jgi:large subunit ribosomal protein L11
LVAEISANRVEGQAAYKPGAGSAPRNRSRWSSDRHHGPGNRPHSERQREMAKKVAGQLKLQVKAGSANPSPPIGPALGQRGINIMEFCKSFNAATQEMEKGMPIPVVITYYQDKSFTFVMKQPPVTYFLKKEAKITSGSKTPGKGATVGKLTKAQIKSIAEAKMKDLNAADIEGAMAMVEGSARAMGLEVVG